MAQQQPLGGSDAGPDASLEAAGAITSVKAGTVSGWVENADPKRALALYIGRRRVATTHQSTSLGGVRSEFAFDARGCPPDLLAREQLSIDVAILGDATSRVASTTIATDAFLKPEDLAASSAANSLEGCIDETSDHLVRGWVHDTARPERQLDLFLFRGGRYLGRYAASRPRPDLAATGRGHGNYGFEIPLQDGVGALAVVAGDPEFWRIPAGAHATAPGGARARLPRPGDLPGAVEAFARALTSTEPFPKKAFVLDKVKQGGVPDAFSADYVALALECLRHEMVATGEGMSGGWRSRLRTWAQMRVLGTRMRRLEELAAAIAEGPRLLEVAARRRAGATDSGDGR